MTVNNTTQKAIARRRPVKLQDKMVNILTPNILRGWEFEGKARVVNQFGHSYRCMVRFENGRNAERTIDPQAQGPNHKMVARLNTLNAEHEEACK